MTRPMSPPTRPKPRQDSQAPRLELNENSEGDRVLVADIALGTMRAGGEAPYDRLHMRYHFNSYIASIYGGWSIVLHINIGSAAAALIATSIASSARAFSTVAMRKRSAHHVSTFRGRLGFATSRSACTRVKTAGRQPLCHLLGRGAGG